MSMDPVPNGALIGGTGTANRIPIWLTPGTVGNSHFADTLGGSFTISYTGTPTANRSYALLDASGTVPLYEVAGTFTAAMTFSTSVTYGTQVRRSGTGNSAPGANGVDVAGDSVVLFSALNQDSRIGVDSSAGTWFKSINTGGGSFKWYTGTAISGTPQATLDPSGNFGFSITPTAGNGLIQLASGTTKANGISWVDTFIWRFSVGMIGLGDSATGGGNSGARHGLYYGQGGFANPGAFQADNNGDKIILYRGDNYDARVGVGSLSNMWFLSGASGAGGGLIEFFTAASSGSATKQDTIGHNTRGFFGVAPVARPSLGAAATDPATTQTLANNIRTALINLGLAQA